MSEFEVDRRGFLKISAGALAAVPVLAAAGCARPDNPTDPDNWLNIFDASSAARAGQSASRFQELPGGMSADALYEVNRSGLDAITLRPRVLVDVSNLDLTTTFLGRTLDSPILVGPSGLPTNSRRGELRTLRGATTANTSMILDGSVAGDMSAADSEPRRHAVWYQLDRSATGDRAQVAEVERALQASAAAICYTPRSDTTGRERIDDTLRRLVGLSALPVLLNGVMTAHDACAAVEVGAAGVIVSNRYAQHGARPTIDVLPEVHAAIGDGHPVLLDGSFRRGTDVLKALSLGARAILVGRPVRWALAAGGAPGVRKVLELLESELALSMALCGRPTISGIDPSLVRRVDFPS